MCHYVVLFFLVTSWFSKVLSFFTPNFYWLMVFHGTDSFSCLFFCASGFEEGAFFPPLPWGVFAPGRVCLHGGHVALPLRLHHHVHSAPQVRGNLINWITCLLHLRFKPLQPGMLKFKFTVINSTSAFGQAGRRLHNLLISHLFSTLMVVCDSSASDPGLTGVWVRCFRLLLQSV